MDKNTRLILISLFAGCLLVGITLTFTRMGIGHPLPWFLTSTLFAIPLLASWSEKRHFTVWKDEYSVGVESLDDDHRKLINLINYLQMAIHYQTGEEFEKQAMDEVVAYTKYHFAREEKMMEDAGYPDLEAHKKTHHEMITKVEEFMDDYENRGHDALEVVARFLKVWLVKHINGTDQEYSSLLKEKGMS